MEREYTQSLNGSQTVFKLTESELIDSLVMLESLGYTIDELEGVWVAQGDYTYTFAGG